MSDFNSICEDFGVLKRVTRERYPKQIKLSEEFLDALKKEFVNQKCLEDSNKPIKNKEEKFLKALKFHIMDFQNTLNNINNKETPDIIVGDEELKPIAPNTDIKNKERRLVLRRNIS